MDGINKRYPWPRKLWFESTAQSSISICFRLPITTLKKCSKSVILIPTYVYLFNSSILNASINCCILEVESKVFYIPTSLPDPSYWTFSKGKAHTINMVISDMDIRVERDKVAITSFCYLESKAMWDEQCRRMSKPE